MLPWSPACFADRADRNQPIHLEADQVLMDDAHQVSTFTGNVRLSQGTLLLSGDKIVVVEDKEGFKHATVYGDTARFRQKREGFDQYVEGYGKRIEYDTRTETLNFHEKARLKRGLDEVSGDNIVYNTKSEVFRVNGNEATPGNEPPQRVRAVLQPKPKEAETAPPRQSRHARKNAYPYGMNMSELRAIGLKKKYGQRTVVHDASLSVKSGEVVGLLGPNGAGKTTTFYMIVGLIAAGGGEIFINDQNITHFPIHRRARLGLGYLPQEASIFRRLTVAQNILAVLELQSLSDDDRHDRLENLLEDLHISHIRNNPAVSLSGGERRRVEIARALATAPAFHPAR